MLISKEVHSNITQHTLLGVAVSGKRNARRCPESTISANFQVLIFSDSSVILGLTSGVLLTSIDACYLFDTFSKTTYWTASRQQEKLRELTRPLIDTAGKIRSGRSEFTAIGLDTFETEPRVLTMGAALETKVSIWY